MRTVFNFPGGFHPHEGNGGKAITAGLPIMEAPLPSRVAIPLQQHIGAPCKALVKKGDKVRVGQMIGEPVGAVSAAIHASVSGTVVDCIPCITANGTQQMSVIIDNDFKDEWVELNPVADPESIDAKTLSELARTMGIVGMGGATFPTAVKVSVPADKKVDTLILNGAECEPYLSADHRLMVEYAEEIVKGARLIQKTLGIERVLIGIEKNKPDAIAAMQEVCKNYPGFETVGLKVKYPQGGEKQLVYALTGRRVRVGKLPLDEGAIVINVGTCYALFRAVYEGRPVVDRVVTVGGNVAKPANYLVRIGAPVEWLLDTSDGILPDTRLLIYGGPMMGMAISRQDIPITKGCSGIVALETVSSLAKESPCIRCGRCVEACPMLLSPATIDRYTRKDMYEQAEQAGVMNCIECGVCSYSCPAKRNLTQSCKVSKRIITQRRKIEAAKKGDQ
ncbi:MAG: electron transport complex subunit RsxC [Clostridiales bacterium]|nr:electron transport complex subunit RsxC [Clostridiales bacterium]